MSHQRPIISVCLMLLAGVWFAVSCDMAVDANEPNHVASSAAMIVLAGLISEFLMLSSKPHCGNSGTVGAGNQTPKVPWFHKVVVWMAHMAVVSGMVIWAYNWRLFPFLQSLISRLKPLIH